MTACTHGQPLWHHLAPGDICPACRTIVADNASPALSAASGAVSAEGFAGLERSRPATIATGVASDRKAGGGPPPAVFGPGSPIADPAPQTATSAPLSGRGTPTPYRRRGAGSASTPTEQDVTPVAGVTRSSRVPLEQQGWVDVGRATSDSTGPTPTPAPSLFAARVSDPDTAHDAAASVSDVQRRRVYQAVLEALVEHGPSTDHDLARYVTGKLGHPIGQTSVGVRRGELCREPFGFVCNSGHKGRTPTGASAIRWALTPAGIDAVGVAA